MISLQLLSTLSLHHQSLVCCIFLAPAVWFEGTPKRFHEVSCCRLADVRWLKGSAGGRLEFPYGVLQQITVNSVKYIIIILYATYRDFYLIAGASTWPSWAALLKLETCLSVDWIQITAFCSIMFVFLLGQRGCTGMINLPHIELNRWQQELITRFEGLLGENWKKNTYREERGERSNVYNLVQHISRSNLRCNILTNWPQHYSRLCKFLYLNLHEL